MTRAKSLPLHYFFSGLVESVFETQLGLPEPSLLDYLSNLLVRFVRLEKHYPLRSLAGKRLTRVTDMALIADRSLGLAARQAYRHIGDFTLFHCGLYPEHFERLPRHNPDRLIDFPELGKRSYLAASQIATDETGQPSCEVLADLSRQYESCAYGLREVRRSWEEDTSARQIYLFN